jgi:hypothetical protein
MSTKIANTSSSESGTSTTDSAGEPGPPKRLLELADAPGVVDQRPDVPPGETGPR